MLDIEIVTPPEQDGTDILSVADLKKRLRITHSRLDDVLEDAIIEAPSVAPSAMASPPRMIDSTTSRIITPFFDPL